MPQASEEDRAEMERRFGDPIGDAGPMEFLHSRGWTLNRDWTWSKPGVTDYGAMPRDEFDCMKFLIHEWDFAGIAEVERQNG